MWPAQFAFVPLIISLFLSGLSVGLFEDIWYLKKIRWHKNGTTKLTMKQILTLRQYGAFPKPLTLSVRGPSLYVII